MKIETTTGFAWEIDDDARDDQELVDAFVEMDAHPEKYCTVLDILLGTDGKAALYEHCRNEKGRVKATRIQHELADIINSMKAGPLKNS
jgi:hypothetical protein